ALSEISEGRTDSIVDKTKLLEIDGSNKEELLCRIQQEVLEMKRELQYHRNLKENTINLIEKWRTDERDFYNTRGTEKVLEKIRSHSTTMIVGHSGSGKSATMRYVSLLLEEEGFEIIPVSYASNILFQRFSTRKQLFIIDDIIGKYRVDDVILESWQRINNRLELIFKSNSAKLLCTLRRHLQNEINELSISTVFNSTVVDLDSNDLVLSLTEKKEIFRNYMKLRNKQDKINSDEIERICRCHYAFPLLCDLFFSNPEFHRRKAKFFSNPTNIFKEELDRMQKKNKEVYCVLVLNRKSGASGVSRRRSRGFLIHKPLSYDAFTKRIQTEIMNGKFGDVLLSKPLQDRDYVNYFLSYLQKNNLSVEDIEHSPCTDSLTPSLQEGEKIIKNITNTNRHAMIEVLQDK
ncbi:uncharacterized protein LOC134249952, partial [Saccostrea cucullata]|uniref:uncharacterized protein LOC134249952 n=1 Tax=Saccostrea cuccullata TaxID=36930 RepID=UPI002ED2F1FF